jgi:hypothetical protein
MSRSLQVSCTIATLLLHSNLALADGDVSNIPAGNDTIIPVHKGEPSPIDGQVFDNDTALRWANWLVQYKALTKMNYTLQKNLCAVDMGLLQKKLEIEESKYDKVTKDLEGKLSKAEDPPFYKTFWFGATVGSLATVAVGVLGVVLVSNTK